MQRQRPRLRTTLGLLPFAPSLVLIRATLPTGPILTTRPPVATRTLLTRCQLRVRRTRISLSLSLNTRHPLPAITLPRLLSRLPPIPSQQLQRERRPRVPFHPLLLPIRLLSPLSATLTSLTTARSAQSLRLQTLPMLLLNRVVPPICWRTTTRCNDQSRHDLPTSSSLSPMQVSRILSEATLDRGLLYSSRRGGGEIHLVIRSFTRFSRMFILFPPFFSHLLPALFFVFFYLQIFLQRPQRNRGLKSNPITTDS